MEAMYLSRRFDSYISSDNDDQEKEKENDTVLHQSPPSACKVFNDYGFAETSEVPINFKTYEYAMIYD